MSRPEELDRLDDSTVTNIDARVLNEAAWLSEGGEGNRLTGLHAKAYVIEYDRRAWNILGSPNATLSGSGRRPAIQHRVRRDHRGIEEGLRRRSLAE